MASLEWLTLLACPREAERPTLRHEVWPTEPPQDWLICTVCGYGYRLEQGIPNMLPEEATSPEELAKLRSEVGK